MKQLTLTAIALALIVSTSVHAESMQFMPGGSRPSIKSREANFTGSVTVDPLYSNNEHTSNTGGHVTFEPGARSAWHTHPAGQVLIVTTGTGWVQERVARSASCDRVTLSGRLQALSIGTAQPIPMASDTSPSPT